MIKVRLMKLFGRWMSRALLGPVQVHGSALDQQGSSAQIILVPHSLSAADCWLFWSRLQRPPVFYDGRRLADCWGYRWLCGRRSHYLDSEVAARERILACLQSGRTLVMSVEARSSSALRRLEQQLGSLQSRHGDVSVQLLTFNYDFRHTLGSPVHWIWRPRAIELAHQSPDLHRELQALQKQAWSINGYQTLPHFPLVTQSGRVPSSLLLSWHEVRARRQWRWPGPSAWLQLPLVLVCSLLNLLPLVAAYLLSHQGTSWRVDQQAAWLGPLYLGNHLVILVLLLITLGAWGVLYLPLLAQGVHPLGHMLGRLIDLEDTPEVRMVRERIRNYFD